MKNLSKLGKRGLALVLALVLLVGMVPLGASALTGTLTINVRVFDGSNVYSIGTDTVDCGNPELIQSVTYQIPYLSRFLKSTEYGRVSKVVGNWYFPSGDTQQGANVEWGTNSRTLTMTYWVDWYRPNGSSGGGGGGETTDNIGTGKHQWTQNVVHHANYPGSSTDITFTRKFTISSFVTSYNGNSSHFTSYDNCGFECPENYEHAEWYSASTGGVKINAPYFEQGKGDIHVYAHYTPKGGTTVTPVTLTYKGNGHTGGTAPNSKEVFVGDSVVISNEGTLERTGYTFLGWSTNQNAKEPDNTYAPGSEVTLTKNETLYAVWKQQSLPTPPQPEKVGEWRLDIRKEVSNLNNKGAAVYVDDLPKNFTVDVTVEYHNGTERITDTKHLTVAGRSNDSNVMLVWEGVFNLPEWQYDFAGNGVTEEDLKDYQTKITISESNYNIDGYKCMIFATIGEDVDNNGVKTEIIPVSQKGSDRHTQSSFGLRNRYNANLVDYRIEWYDTDGNSIKDAQTYQGRTGTTVSVTQMDKEITSYTFKEDDSRNVLSDTLAASGTVLKLYFEKNAETPNISITKTPDATAYTAGDDVSWNITVANNGTSAVSGLSIVDELTKDGELFTGNVTITGPAELSGTSDNFTLEANTSVTFKAIVAEAEAGTYVNTATVEKDGEPLAEDTSDDVVVTEETAPAAPAITVQKQADKTAAKAGEMVTYTITVENTGDAPATDVTVTDVLDSNLTFVSYQLGEGTVDTQPEGGVYTIGTLAAGDVATLVIQATVNADVEAGTIIVNTATADYDGKPDEENPTDHADVNVIQPDPVDPDPDPTDPGPGPVDPPTPPTPIVTPEPVATPTPSADPAAEPTDDPGVDIPDPTQPPLGPGPSDDPGTDIPDEDPPMGDNPILNLVDHYHYLVGYPDGSIRPGANITRAEVAEVFYRLMTADARVANWATGNSYSDVTGTAWYTDAINVMSKAGIVNGYEDGTARPNRAITRAEFAMIASQFLADYVEDPGTTTFTDIQGHWAESAIRKVQSIGWVNGDAGTTNFRPNDKITRAEAAVIFNNMLERTPDAEHLDGEMKVWPDNDPGAWYYAAMQEATNSHYYTGNEGTANEEWAEVFEHDWVALKAYWKANAGQSPEE